MSKLWASYNTWTGEVSGCEEGSGEWYHEMRHKWQFKKVFVTRLNHILCLISGVGMALCIGGVIWYYRGDVGYIYLFIIGSLMQVPSFVFLQILEIDANIYQYRKKKELNLK